MSRLFKYLWIIVRKLLPPLLLAGAVLAGAAWWLHRATATSAQADPVDQAPSRSARQAALRDDMAKANQQIDRLSLEITAERKRAEQAGKIVNQLRDQQSTWDRLTGGAEQQRANAEQIAKMERIRADALARAAANEAEVTRLTWQRDARELALHDLETQPVPAASAETFSGPLSYVNIAWERVKWILLGVVIAWFVLPPVVRFIRWWRATDTAAPPAK